MSEQSSFQGLKIPSWALPLLWGISLAIGGSIAGLWLQMTQGQQSAMREMAELRGAVQTSSAVNEQQLKTLNNSMKRLETRVDVDNQTRYTVGEAKRDFALVDRKLDDHEGRIRALEKK